MLEKSSFFNLPKRHFNIMHSDFFIRLFLVNGLSIFLLVFSAYSEETKANETESLKKPKLLLITFIVNQNQLSIINDTAQSHYDDSETAYAVGRFLLEAYRNLHNHKNGMNRIEDYILVTPKQANLMDLPLPKIPLDCSILNAFFSISADHTDTTMLSLAASCIDTIMFNDQVSDTAISIAADASIPYFTQPLNSLSNLNQIEPGQRILLVAKYNADKRTAIFSNENVPDSLCFSIYQCVKPYGTINLGKIGIWIPLAINNASFVRGNGLQFGLAPFNGAAGIKIYNLYDWMGGSVGGHPNCTT
jgi:hypothetical protein